MTTIQNIASRFWATRALLLPMLLASSLVGAAGRVEFVEGVVTAQNRDGMVRTLAKGDRVVAQEIITTDKMSEAHLVMDDNGVIALRPNTRLRIDAYVADGDKDRDTASLALLQGAIRSVTGWISKINRDRFVMKTRISTIGVRGTDFEAVDVEEPEGGAERGTYVKVTEGETVVKTAAGEVNVSAGLFAFAGFGNVKPRTLSSPPPVFKPTANEGKIDAVKKEAANTMEERLSTRQRMAKLPACTGENEPQRVLDEFIRAFESGNLALIRDRIDPNMPGYQRFIDNITQDINNLKQLRLFIKDVQVQCGPDLTVIQLTWEKRYLELLTFEPRLVTGRGSILLHRFTSGWRLAAVGGDNPFASRIGSLARLTFGPSFDISALEAAGAAPGVPQPRAAAPGEVNVVIEVQDADLATRSSINVELTTSGGDREVVSVSSVRPGVFRRDRVPASTNPPVAGNAVLEVRSGQVITLRYVDPQPGSDRPATSLTQMVTVTGTPFVIDTTPDAYSFASQNGVAPNTPVESAAVVISGINRPAPVSITGGQYRINGGAASAANGTISSGQRLSVVVQSAPEPNGVRSATVSVGGVTATFSVTTAGIVITTPEPFSFTPATGVAPNTQVVSNAITVRGINAPSTISVIGGDYSINGGSFTNAPGTVRAGDSVTVRVLSSSVAGNGASATLTIGGVSGTFNVTTAGASGPDAISFSPVTGATPNSNVGSNTVTISGLAPGATAPISIVGGVYSINGGPQTSGSGTVRSGDVVQVIVQASSTPGGTASATLTVGNRTATFSVTTAASTFAPDTTPDPFNFVNVTGATPGAPVQSNVITVTGVNTFTPIAVSGGEFNVSGSPFTASPSFVQAGNTVQLRANASPLLGGVVPVTLTIGGVAATWTVQTTTVDTTPDAFSFAPAVGVALRSVQTSNSVTITGINMPSPVTVTGGEYSIAGGAFTASAGAINNGQTLQLRGTAAPAFNQGTAVIVNVGGVSAAFNISTGMIDTTPDAFNLVAQNNVPLRTDITSNTITVTGINAPAPITIVGGSYSINGGAFTNASGTVDQGQTVAVRVTSSPMFSTPTSATLTIGGVAGTFTATTVAIDTTPDAFTFAPQSNVAVNSPITSNTITVTGINAAAPISIVGGTYSVNGGAFTNAAGTVDQGQTVAVRVTSSPMFSTPTSATLTVGGVAGTFTATTVAIDTTPDAFSFAPVNCVPPAIAALPVVSNTVTITGINAPAAISVVGGGYSINGAASTTAPGTISAGQTLSLTTPCPAAPGTSATVTVTVGGVSASFVVTYPIDTTPDVFTLTAVNCTPAGFGPMFDVPSNVVTITGINAPATVTATGAGVSINGGPRTTSGTIANGQTLQAFATCPAAVGTSASTVVTVGGVSATFTVTNPVDTTPNPFNFATVNNCFFVTVSPPAVTTPSAPIIVSGINAPAPISAAGGSYSINGGAFTTAPGTVNNGDQVRAGLNCPSPAVGFSATMTVTIGGVSGSYTINGPVVDTTPDPFTIPNTLTCPLAPTQTNSGLVTITGINSPTSVSMTPSGLNPGGTQISIAGGPFGSGGTISNGQTIQLRATGYGTINPLQLRATVNIGGVVATWFTSC